MLLGFFWAFKRIVINNYITYYDKMVEYDRLKIIYIKYLEILDKIHLTP